METIILVILGFVIVFITFVLIKTLLWQKKLASHLPLSKQKNNQILFKQGSFLALSVVVFAFALNQQGYLNTGYGSFSSRSVDTLGALEAVENYKQHSADEAEGDISIMSENQKVIGTITLENHITYVLVKHDNHYFLVDDQENKVIEFKSAP